MLTWALQRPCALVFDEYDAGRADVMFVIQRVLEVEGRLTLLDQSRVIEPHPAFRLFATANTVGLGDATGLYHGTQPLNQGQMDRWNIVVTLNYLAHDREVDVVLARCPEYRNADGRAQVERDGRARQPDAPRVCRRRSLDRHVAAHGRHLGGERDALPRPGARVQADVPQPLRRGRARARRRVLPALHGRRTCRRRPARRRAGTADAAAMAGPASPRSTVEAVGACTRALAGRCAGRRRVARASDAATLGGLRAFGDRLALQAALSRRRRSIGASAGRRRPPRSSSTRSSTRGSMRSARAGWPASRRTCSRIPARRRRAALARVRGFSGRPAPREKADARRPRVSAAPAAARCSTASRRSPATLRRSGAIRRRRRRVGAAPPPRHVPPAASCPTMPWQPRRAPTRRRARAQLPERGDPRRRPRHR